MKIALRVIGWLGIILSLWNGYTKLFGSDFAVARYAGGTRDIDLNITVLAFCLIFLALAAILDRLDGN